MRKAVVGLGFVVGAVMLAQSILAYNAAAETHQPFAPGTAVCLVMSVAMIVAAVVAIRSRQTAAVIYMLTAGVLFRAGLTSSYSYLPVWSIVAFVLAVMSL